ncbi:MAG: histidine--tRNA ligase [Anaerolineae bacterium]|nr:histidine--tRNA ligase [Anaerolineae bacterium]
MSNVIRPVKGTRDFYPEEMGIRTWLYQNMRAVSESFGYQEYEAPILESLELYAAKSGEEIVQKQSYVFTDRSGDQITLRPELTPSLARMVAKRQNELTFPLRWWSFGPFWRYERPQKGRTREFFQWNIDMIGDPSPEADAELVLIAATFLKQIGLTAGEYRIRINNRALMEQEIISLGIQDRLLPEVFGLIDRKEKMPPGDWLKSAEEVGLSTQQTELLSSLLENKDLWKKSPTLVKIFEIVKAAGMDDVVEFDAMIIRGLLYYTGTVLEAWDTQGEFRALFGGGRYDNLVGDVGGTPVGGVGFAVGDLVLTLLLQSLNRLPDTGKTPSKIYVTCFSEELFVPSMQLSQDLRREGFNVTTHLGTEKLGKQFKYADRIGAKIVLVIGPDELDQGLVTIKDLASGDQKQVSREDLVNTLHQDLEALSPS